MLWSAMLPSVYLIMMLVGRPRWSCGPSLCGVVFRAITGWILIMAVYITCGLLFRLAMNDFGAFVNRTVANPVIRYYPLAVFIIAMTGFWYPRADFFNINRTRSKRVILFFVCFMPLYLMLGYMLFVKSDLWELCLRFGFRSSMLAFIISFPVIFFNAPDGLSQACYHAVRYLFQGLPAKSNDDSTLG